VGVREAAEAAPSFHARRDADWKWYRYSILVSRRKRPLLARRTWRVARVPPLEALEAACAPMLGRHDFRSLSIAESAPEDAVRTVHVLRWREEDDLLHLDVVGDGFLRRMVRTLVGTALAAARDVDPAGAVRTALEARDRARAGPSAPARGLCLMAVALKGEPVPGGVPSFLAASVESARLRLSGDRP
jgi:tRNA pseudouridine38-40 synthase